MKSIKLAAVLLFLLNLSGCVTTYTFNGKKYQSAKTLFEAQELWNEQFLHEIPEYKWPKYYSAKIYIPPREDFIKKSAITNSPGSEAAINLGISQEISYLVMYEGLKKRNIFQNLELFRENRTSVDLENFNVAILFNLASPEEFGWEMFIKDEETKSLHVDTSIPPGPERMMAWINSIESNLDADLLLTPGQEKVVESQFDKSNLLHSNIGNKNSNELSGVPIISDGDSLKIWNQGIRLAGIDAPETAQTCTKKDGSLWKCGEASANYLQKITKGKEITCEGSEIDKYKRLLATCYVGDVNINQHLIDQGWAVAYIEYSDMYLSHERKAQQKNKGIWNTNFIRPAEFRSGEWQRAESTSNQTKDGCVIKGNINRKGERIYHTPWSRSYNKTKISTSKGERWFCTESEALAAGWRAPYR